MIDIDGIFEKILNHAWIFMIVGIVLYLVAAVAVIAFFVAGFLYFTGGI